MRSRGSSNSSGFGFHSRISAFMLAMFPTMVTIYAAGRIWQDAESRVYLIQELDRRTGQENPAMSVDDTLKVILCREQQKKLSALEMDLSAARQEGAALEKLEEEKGIVVRFMIGRSSDRGDSLDREIDNEHSQTNDFIVLNHVEAPEERSKKIKIFFVHAVESWDAEFYVKVNDDVCVNIDTLGATLSTHLDEPRVYMGCMKSGQVFSEPYFRHASGEIYAISRALAQFISINKSILRIYAHDDVSAGSWFIGLDVKHVDESKFCCSPSSTGHSSSAPFLMLCRNQPRAQNTPTETDIGCFWTVELPKVTESVLLVQYWFFYVLNGSSCRATDSSFLKAQTILAYC
ncbi:putative beta-1,3-galactosyltransferase 11 [Hibiscus syriacus]|uniref:Hexosyltransferase n=1 Tax=Hibiscus syriacus TaxID=106335 RepID=A0A6A2WJ90_HIBSY|nr:putative beta-1,3-galactosyltransferase 11 [Hibiscus syriacus]